MGMRRFDRVKIAHAVLGTWIALGAGLAARPARAADPEAVHVGISPDGSFRVRGPVAFHPLATEDAHEPVRTVGVEAVQHGAFDGVTKYVASCVVDAADRRGAAQRIEATLARWKAQAPFQYQTDVEIGKLAGVEFQLSDRQKTLRVRVVAPPGRTCTVLVQWNRFAKPRAEAVDRFLASFEPRKR